MGTALVAIAPAVAGFTEKAFAGTEVSLNYVEGPGNGPPLVLLHGLSRDWRSFSVLLPDLSRKFHVYAIDLRGHGGSGRKAGSYRISEFAHDVAEFVRTHAPSGAAIFGHSLGAATAIMVAATGDCRVKALIVGDTMITPENFRGSLYSPLFRQLHGILLQGDQSRDALAAAIGKIVIPVPGLDEPVRIEELPGNTSEVLGEWARCAFRTDPDALLATVDGAAYEDWRADNILPRIACPTLLLQGNPELDGLLSDGDVKLALSLLPNAQHVKFHLLGHALFMHQAKPVLEAIVPFLSKTRTQAQ
jgi:pimeloyl-ACP methyl ester carboxylesterase